MSVPKAEKLPLTRSEIDTLVAIVEHGPVESGSIPSKNGASCLIVRGYAFYTVVKGEQGYLAVTPAGVEAYKSHFGTVLGGTCDTIGEAQAMRLAQAGMNRAFQSPSKGK